MAYLAIERDESLTETIKDISRQMEDLLPQNAKDEEFKKETDQSTSGLNESISDENENKEILDEIPLNIDINDDTDEYKENNKLEEDNISLEQLHEQSQNASTNQESKDQIGIDLEEDELWEDEEVEEISLFEDELLSELKKDEEKATKPTQDESKVQEDKKSLIEEDLEKHEESSKEKASQKLEEDVSKGELDINEEIRDIPQDKEIKADDVQKGFFQKVLAIFPWIVTFFSTILCILAIFTIFNLWKNASLGKNGENIFQSDPLKKEITQPTIGVEKGSFKKQISDFQSVDLAPFIIPGRSGGELVFFKLQVEIVVPDAITKQALLRRQAWVRDIIYQELKGLDISNGIKGNVLQKYKRPLIIKLNKELSPIKIEDVRLMGYILR